MQIKKITAFDMDIFLVKRKNQKKIRLCFNKKGELQVSVPFFVSEKKALSFVEENLDWVKKHQDQQKTITFQNGDFVSILGIVYKIKHDEGQKKGIVIDDNNLIVGGECEFLHRRVVNFAKKELIKYICEKSNMFSGLIGKKINRITLKDTSSRWGSCSSKGNLNFCFKIVFAPIFVIDYLIAHEVSHLKEMNHSDHFWKTVAIMNVERSQAEIWLRKNGRELLKIK